MLFIVQPATGGPPRYFALSASVGGAVLAGTCGRGTSRSGDGGRTWTPLPGIPGSGWVNDFAWCDGSVLAATAGTGLQRSHDNGLAWTPTGLDDGTLYAVTAMPDAALLVGTDGDGVLRSTDGGASWQSLGQRLAGTTVYRLVGLVSGAVLAGTDGAGAWIWYPGADEWEPAGLRGHSIYAVVELPTPVPLQPGPEPTPSSRFLAGTREGGLHRSDDEGRTWWPSGDHLPDGMVHTLVADGPDAVLAGTGRGVARSADRGETWGPLTNKGDDLASRRIFSLARTLAGDRLAGSYDGVWFAPAGSNRWSAVDTGLADDTLAVHLGDDGVLLAATGRGGVHCSHDAGATWEVSGTDVGTAYAFARLASGHWLVGVDGGVLAQGGADPGWQRCGLAGERVFCLLEPEPGMVLAGTLASGVHRLCRGDQGGTDAAGSRDSNSHSHSYTGGDSHDHDGKGANGGGWAPTEGLPHPMALDLLRTSQGSVLVATAGIVDGTKTGGIHRSEDGGHTWAPTATPPVAVYRLVEASTGVLLAGAQRSTILRSLDGGAHWELVATTGLVGWKLYALAIDGHDRLYLGAGFGLCRSDDGGTTWFELTAPELDGVTVFDLACHPSGAVVAATSAGLLRSIDAGSTWHGTTTPAATETVSGGGALTPPASSLNLDGRMATNGVQRRCSPAAEPGS
jgi:hypothetical protein